MPQARTRWIRSHIAISVVTVVLFLVFSYTTLHFAARYYFAEAGQAHAVSVARSCASLLEQQRTLVAEFSKSWAYWDDLYDFVKTRDPAFGDSNLTQGAVEATGMNVLAIVARDGEILEVRAYDSSSGELVAPPRHLAGARVEGGFARLLRGTGVEQPTTGYVNTEQGPLVAAGVPILTSAVLGPARGTFIVGRFLDTALAEALSADSGYPIAFDSNRNEMGPRAGENPLDESGQFLVSRAETGLRIRAVYRDVSGHPAFSMVVDLPDTTERLARRAIWTAFLVLAAGILAGACAATFLNLWSADRWLKPAPLVPEGGGFPLLAGMVALGGLALSLALFVFVRGTEREAVEARFREVAVTVQQLLPQRLAGLAGSLESLQQFFAASDHVDRDEFHRFTSVTLAREPGIHALVWLPRVPHAQRAQFEEEARAAGMQNSVFAIQDPAGELAPVGERAEYFPAYYVEPLAGNEQIMLFDAGSDPGFNEVLERARDENRALVTYIENREAVPGLPDVFLMFAPLYREGRAGNTVEARRQALVGYAGGMFLTREIVRAVLPEGLRPDVAVEVRALTTPTGQPAIRVDDARASAAGLWVSDEFEFGGTRWQVICRATPEFIAGNAGYLSWLVLLTGIVFSVLLSGVIAVRGRQLAYLHQIIADHDRPELTRAVRFRWRVQIPALAALFLLAAAFLVWADIAGRTELRRQVEQARAEAERVWRAAMRDTARRLLDRMSDFTAMPGVRAALLAGNREALVAEAAPHLRALQLGGELDSLGFLSPDGTMVARVHAPGVHGDRPDRPILRAALRTQEPVWTAESGSTVSLSLAAVLPWREEAILLGYIASSKPMVEIIEQVEAQLPCRLLLLLHRETASRDAFERERALGRTATVWDSGTGHIALSKRPPSGLQELLRNFEALGDDDARIFRHAPGPGESYFCEALRVDAIDGTELGHILVMMDAAPLERNQRQAQWVLVTLCIVLGIPLALGLSMATSNIEERLAISVAAREEAIAEAKRLAVQAEQANAAKSEFLANISHEIRTPMNGVIGVAGLLAATPLDETQRRFVEVIRRSGESLLEVISDVLDFAKIEARRVDIQSEVFDPRVLVEHLADLLAVRANEKGVQLGLRIAPDVPERVSGDPGRVRQVLTNLLGNAIKFTEQGEVAMEVSCEAADEAGIVNLRFAVRDTGIGIPAAKLDKLFVPFTQLDSSATRKHGGSGLGLAISQQLAELMGGRITVDSREGEGSTFAFQVPVRLVAETARRRPVAPVPREVLLVEDNAVNQMVAEAMLQRMGHRVTCAANGLDALDKLRKARYEVVIMDCQMPLMDGFEATRAVRAAMPGGLLDPDVPIIAMTAASAEVDRQRCLEAGMNGYVSKPVTEQALAQAIEACFRPSGRFT